MPKKQKLEEIARRVDRIHSPFLLLMSKQDQPTDEVKEEAEETEIFVLDDIRVDTLGLVERGAVDETIFLMKNQGGVMDEEETTEKTLNPLEQLGAERVQQLLDLGKQAETVEKASKIGTFLRRQREAKEMTAEAVAESMPIEAGTVLSIESGEIPTPSIPVLRAFADMYDVSFERLRGMLPSGATPRETVSTNKAKDKDKDKRKPMTKNLTVAAARGVKGLLDSYGEELPENVVNMLASLLADSAATGGGGEENTQKDQDGNEVTKMAEEKVKGGVEVVEEKVQPAPAETDPALAELLTRLEKSEKVNADAMTRLEKAETELAKAQEVARQEREARERIVYIEKAREFEGLGVDADKMGSFLHSLASSDQTANVEKAADAEDRSDLYDYIVSVLKAASAQIVETGFYKEVGSSKMPDTHATLIDKAEAAVKAGEYTDVTEALLHASEKEQRAYLAKVRQ